MPSFESSDDIFSVIICTLRETYIEKQTDPHLPAVVLLDLPVNHLACLRQWTRWMWSSINNSHLPIIYRLCFTI